MSRLHGFYLPVRLDERKDGCAITGTAVDGGRVHFEDLLKEGDRVATFNDGEGNYYGPFGTVVRDPDGDLWVMPEGEATDGTR